MARDIVGRLALRSTFPATAKPMDEHTEKPVKKRIVYNIDSSISIVTIL